MSSNKQAAQQLTLTGKQKKYLRGLAHHLEPVVYIGREGLSETVIQSVLDTLKTRELIKVKMGQNCAVPKKEAAAQLAEVTQTALVQLIGKTIILFQPNKDLKSDERIALPKG